MGRWALIQAPELIPVPVDPREYDQALAGISEILYRVFHQLDPKKKVTNPKALSIGTSVTTICPSEADQLTEGSQ